MHFTQSDAIDVFEKYLQEIHPTEIISDTVSFNPDSKSLIIKSTEYNLRESKGIYLIGTGKASVQMARALASILGDELVSGMIIASDRSDSISNTIKTLSASHPLPDNSSLEATESLIKYVTSIPKGAVVINLISGGTSSLFCKPADGISMSDYSIMVDLLIRSGASIDEINLVRKSVSSVKAGRFLKLLSHTKLIDLIISDVPNDDSENIGSGPTTAQSFSFKDVISVLEKYELLSKLPVAIRQFILERSSLQFKSKEIGHHQYHIILSAKKAAQTAARIISKKGFEVHLQPEAWTGTIEDFQQHILNETETHIHDSEPTALIFYGECTVNVTGDGKGGRNQELALRIADSLSKYDRDFIFLSAGTDGIDGPTDAAGAVVTHQTKSKAGKMGVDLNTYLRKNDSYHFFDQFGGHIKTGPTGNNVMDLQFLFIP